MKLLRAAAPRLLAAAPLLFLLAAGGCQEAYSAGKNLQVRNETDVFQFQISDMKNYSHTFTYRWINSGSLGAIVNQSSTISGGDATLVLKDALGTTVYSRSLKQNGRFTSTDGASGEWTVQILANKVTGSVLLRADRN